MGKGWKVDSYKNAWGASSIQTNRGPELIAEQSTGSEGVVSKSPEPLDPKEKFKEALEKKKSPNTHGLNKGASEVSSKIHAASGKKLKMFRRKSG